MPELQRDYMIWWWLSFASTTENLGVAVVEGRDMIDAVRRAHQLRINPGGQVAGWPAGADFGPPAEHWRNRLITDWDEKEALSQDWTGTRLRSASDDVN